MTYLKVNGNYTSKEAEYLVRNIWLTPIQLIKLKLKKMRNASNQELADLEYSYRFKNYANGWEKQWTKSNWGNNEQESLDEYAYDALRQNARKM